MTEQHRRLAEFGLEDPAETPAAHEVGVDVLSLVDEAGLEEIGLGPRKRLLEALPDLLGAPAAGLSPRGRPPNEAERRHTTVLFRDKVSPTAFSRRFDPESCSPSSPPGGAAASRSSNARASRRPISGGRHPRLFRLPCDARGRCRAGRAPIHPRPPTSADRTGSISSSPTSPANSPGPSFPRPVLAAGGRARI